MEGNDYLVAGLGNPGEQYRFNRHNVGFQVINELATRLGSTIFQEKWNAFSTSLQMSGKKIHLVKPNTFMNLSGRAVAQYYRFFKLSPDRLLVIHDDLDMTCGRIKLVKGGGTGGHNGIKSLVECLGTKDFYRLKVGIGRPGKGDVPLEIPVERYVLSDFSETEMAFISIRYSTIEEGVALFFQEKADLAMGLLNALK
ncbi:MAG: aminoacyl-tRNA hydrolase [Desulforhopalus sp.]|nr:aminoacyl-tRNA hydrolase [Desulforhopalus sp.]